ncbi:MAG: hypothetical protein AABZ26_05060 [Chloroflexota bacterium]
MEAPRRPDRASSEDLYVFLLLAAPIFLVTLGVAALVVTFGTR